MDGAEIVKRGDTGARLIPVEPEYTATDFLITDETRSRIIEGVPENTQRAYIRQWNLFESWCSRLGRVSLPATAQTFADYVTFLAGQEFAPATISQAMGAIRSRHRTNGHQNRPDSQAALLVLRGYRRERAENGERNQREALPVTIPTLRRMVEAADLSTPVGIRNRLVLVLGLALMGRRSELVALHQADVILVEEGLEVSIRTSKTDKESRGEVIAIPRGSHPLTDPVAAWHEWTALLVNAGHTSGRLLRRVDRYGNFGPSLTGTTVNDIVRSLAHQAGILNWEDYTAHSLRAGGATVAYAAGVPISVIARHGRWSPTSPVMLRYIRAVDKWRDNAMRGVGL